MKLGSWSWIDILAYCEMDTILVLRVLTSFLHKECDKYKWINPINKVRISNFAYLKSIHVQIFGGYHNSQRALKYAKNPTPTISILPNNDIIFYNACRGDQYELMEQLLSSNECCVSKYRSIHGTNIISVTSSLLYAFYHKKIKSVEICMKYVDKKEVIENISFLPIIEEKKIRDECMKITDTVELVDYVSRHMPQNMNHGKLECYLEPYKVNNNISELNTKIISACETNNFIVMKQLIANGATECVYCNKSLQEHMDLCEKNT